MEQLSDQIDIRWQRLFPEIANETKATVDTNPAFEIYFNAGSNARQRWDAVKQNFQVLEVLPSQVLENLATLEADSEWVFSAKWSAIVEAGHRVWLNDPAERETDREWMSLVHGHDNRVWLDAADKNGTTLLMMYSNAGKKGVVETLIEWGANIHAVGMGRMTALHFAVMKGKIETAKILIDEGADLQVRSVKGDTPLFVATRREDLDSIQMLLTEGADPNIGDTDNLTPLHWSVLNKNPNIAKVLLGNKADPNAVSIDGAYPLHLAAGAGCTRSIELLLARGAQCNALVQGQTPLFLAISHFHTAAVRALLAGGTNPNIGRVKGFSALVIAIQAASRDDTTVADLLIQYGADVNAIQELNQATALHGAAGAGRTAHVKLLLSKGADHGVVDSNGCTALDLAIGHNRKDVVKLLREAAKTDDQDNAPAAVEGNSQRFAYLFLTAIILVGVYQIWRHRSNVNALFKS